MPNFVARATKFGMPTIGFMERVGERGFLGDSYGPPLPYPLLSWGREGEVPVRSPSSLIQVQGDGGGEHSRRASDRNAFGRKKNFSQKDFSCIRAHAKSGSACPRAGARPEVLGGPANSWSSLARRAS
jgi:hypothetical protein